MTGQEAEATTFEDAWDAKYAAEPGEAEQEGKAADGSAAEMSDQSAPQVEAPGQSQELPDHIEPGEQTEPSPQPPKTDGDDGEDFRTKYEGIKPRYQAEERKRKAAESRVQELEQRLRELEERSKPPAQKVAPGLNLDDAEIGEIEDFRRKHPDIAKATVDNPDLSANWQKLLLERGEDEVIVTYETARGSASGAEKKVMAELERRDAEAHLHAIESEHPDWRELVVNPNPQNQQDLLHPDFVQWIDMLPMKVGQGVVWACQHGNATNVNTIFQAYKDYRANLQAQKPESQRGQASTPSYRTPQQQAAVRGAMAVPGKGTPPPKPGPGSNATFDELWDAKYGRK